MVEAPQGVKLYRNVCPSVHSPTLAEWKYGNLESRALRVTCQIPLAGLCYVANICHRLSQTPHLGVRNAGPGRGRGLMRHQLLNQCEREDGVGPELLASLACTSRAETMLEGTERGRDGPGVTEPAGSPSSLPPCLVCSGAGGFRDLPGLKR